MGKKMEMDEQWHLDKKVPISLIAAIAMQTIGFSWYASSLNERVGQLERDNPSAHAELQKLEEARETTIRAIDALTFQTKVLDKSLEGQEKHFTDLSAAVERVANSVRDIPRKVGESNKGQGQ